MKPTNNFYANSIIKMGAVTVFILIGSWILDRIEATPNPTHWLWRVSAGVIILGWMISLALWAIASILRQALALRKTSKLNSHEKQCHCKHR